MKTVLVFLIVFSVVVVIHEFGHFYFAKRAGILVREFAIGMGPKLFSHQGKDGTTYTIRALPMGGYVRMAGYEEEEIKAGMQVGLVLDQKDTVVKINTSHKVQLTNAIPLEVAQQDLVDALTITGYVNGDESQTVTYPVAHDAIIIEEDGTEVRIAPRDVQFQSAKLWQRMLTNFAGPMNNFLLTIAIFILAAFLNGGSADRNSTIINVVENGAAASAGLKDGDEIMAINQEPVENWAQVSQIIQANPEKELQIEVKRENQTQTFTAVPKAIEAGEQKVGQLGIQAPLKTGFFDKIIGGFQESIAAFFRIIDALRSLLTNFSIDQLGGPVAIFQLSSEAAKQGPMTVLMMTAMISINLGIFNLLPIPGLDGGKLLLNIIEGVRGKPLSQEKEGIITLVGFGLLMLLMVLVTWNDIQRFFF